jgi:hypothetical protein
MNFVLRSRGRLGRELQLVFVGRNFTACLARLWRLPSVYFPLSLPLVGSPVDLNYLQKPGDVKAWEMSMDEGRLQVQKEA